VLRAAVVLGLVPTVLALPARGGESGTRRVDKAYVGFSGIAQSIGGETIITPSPSSSLTFRARGDESFVQLKVVDELGARVRAFVTYDRDGDGRFDGVADFCGFTHKPIPIANASRVSVDLYAGTCASGQPSVVSRGMVRVKFSP
ncbi:MAG: hypothetical protein M3198_18455, partial [Actinomycetota bacterium]|nr:hypothetical protein [Actinomycetota bacterium]